MTVYISGTTGYSGPVGVLGDLTTTGNTILGDASTDTLNVANGNLVLNSSGNAGLGVTPSAWGSSFKSIDVNAYTSFYGTTNNAYSGFSQNAYYNGTNWIYRNTNAASNYIQSGGTHVWQIAPSGTAGNAVTFTQAMTLDASGNLLVGATSGSSRLVVGGSSGQVATPTAIEMDGTYRQSPPAFDKLKFYLYKSGTESYGFGLGASGDIQYWAGTSSTGIHVWYTSQTERARINSSGNLLVGTTSTYNGERLVVDSNGASSVYNSKFVYSGTSTTAYCVTTWGHGQVGAAVGYIGVGGSAVGNPTFQNNFVVGTQSANALVFNTGDSERARIDTAGRLQVNTTGQNGMIAVANVAGVSPAIHTRTSVTGAQGLIEFYNPNGLVGQIITSGSATSYATSSDYRLKNTIAPMTGALAKVGLLKPVTYKWNADGSDGQGFIAHELAEVVPHCVTGEKDAVDAEGNPKYQSIDTSFLVATLTAAIQELKSELDSVKAELAALKGN